MPLVTRMPALHAEQRCGNQWHPQVEISARKKLTREGSVASALNVAFSVWTEFMVRVRVRVRVAIYVVVAFSV